MQPEFVLANNKNNKNNNKNNNNKHILIILLSDYQRVEPLVSSICFSY